MILICVAFIVVLRYNHILVTNSEVFSQIFLSDSDDPRFCTQSRSVVYTGTIGAPIPATVRGIFLNCFQDSLFQSSIIDDWEMHLVNMVL